MKNQRTLGVKSGQLMAMPATPNAVSSQTQHQRMRVEPLPMSGSTAETKSRIIECLKQMGGNIIESQSDNYIHAVFRSLLMRFKDDVEFYIDKDSKLVHFRSASRIGHSDFGANRKRYNRFKALYKV